MKVTQKNPEWVIKHHEKFKNDCQEYMDAEIKNYEEAVREEVRKHGGDGGTREMHKSYLNVRKYMIQNPRNSQGSPINIMSEIKRKFSTSVGHVGGVPNLDEDEHRTMCEMVRKYGWKKYLQMITKAEAFMSRSLVREAKPLLAKSKAVYDKAFEGLEGWAAVKVNQSSEFEKLVAERKK